MLKKIVKNLIYSLMLICHTPPFLYNLNLLRTYFRHFSEMLLFMKFYLVAAPLKSRRKTSIEPISFFRSCCISKLCLQSRPDKNKKSFRMTSLQACLRHELLTVRGCSLTAEHKSTNLQKCRSESTYKMWNIP